MIKISGISKGSQELVRVEAVFKVMPAHDQVRCPGAAMGDEFAFAARLGAHVAVGERKAVLVEPAFGLAAVGALRGGVHDDFPWPHCGCQRLQLLDRGCG